MIKHAIATLGLQVEVKSVLTDFELGIQMAAQAAFPWVELRRCRFHFAKVKENMENCIRDACSTVDIYGWYYERPLFHLEIITGIYRRGGLQKRGPFSGLCY